MAAGSAEARASALLAANSVILNSRAVQILPSDAQIDSTVRDLGVDVETALELAKRTEV